jgi:cytoskeletal protein RodZ
MEKIKMIKRVLKAIENGDFDLLKRKQKILKSNQ